MSKADKFFRRAERLVERLERLFPVPSTPFVNDARTIAWRWRRQPNGSGYLQAVTRFNRIGLDDLLHVERQKEALVRNTRQFLAGLPANNALLWGPRGTGKSSLVKALLNDFAADGLRMVEVDRMDLVHLPDIVASMHGDDARYIIYCDDLSFDANDATYRALKAVLDGSVLDTPRTSSSMPRRPATSFPNSSATTSKPASSGRIAPRRSGGRRSRSPSASGCGCPSIP